MHHCRHMLFGFFANFNPARMLVHVKQNARDNKSLLREASGLQVLREQVSKLNLSFIKVPEVYSVSPSELKLEKIRCAAPGHGHMQAFGHELAVLHSVKEKHYGWHENNFIGLSPQFNQLSDYWGEFFIDFRLQPQVASIQSEALKMRFQRILSSKRQTLSDYLCEHCQFPSLLHGDMWAGNVLFDKHNAWLIDPAVYWGDGEADIAMSQMFGGFCHDFYSGYQQKKALSSEYPVKKQIYNLYHYLNHLNLFGSGYQNGCEQGFSIIARL